MKRPENSNVKHGTPTCYRYGCKRPECRAAASLRANLWKVQRARQGPLLVDAAPWRAALRAANAAGVNLGELSRTTGVAYDTLTKVTTGQRIKLTRRNADRLLEPLTAAVNRQLAATKKAVNAVDALYCEQPEQDPRRFPAEPLLELVVARYGSLKASGQLRNLIRLRETGLSVAQADRWALKLLGKLPEEVWPEFNESAA